MDIDKIQALIKFVSKQGVTEVELETEEFKIVIKSDKNTKDTSIIHPQMPAVAPVQMQAPIVHQQVLHPPAEVKVPVEPKTNYITVKSPMIGTFYRSSNPEKPTFVEVGATIKVGSVTCIIEAMKLFNEIESEISGTIVKILVDDATPVEYDQPLFLVDPA